MSNKYSSFIKTADYLLDDLNSPTLNKEAGILNKTFNLVNRGTNRPLNVLMRGGEKTGDDIISAILSGNADDSMINSLLSLKGTSFKPGQYEQLKSLGDKYKNLERFVGKGRVDRFGKHKAGLDVDIENFLKENEITGSVKKRILDKYNNNLSKVTDQAKDMGYNLANKPKYRTLSDLSQAEKQEAAKLLRNKRIQAKELPESMQQGDDAIINAVRQRFGMKVPQQVALGFDLGKFLSGLSTKQKIIGGTAVAAPTAAALYYANKEPELPPLGNPNFRSMPVQNRFRMT